MTDLASPPTTTLLVIAQSRVMAVIATQTGIQILIHQDGPSAGGTLRKLISQKSNTCARELLCDLLRN